MILFQKSVEKKYLNELDSTLIDTKFAEYQGYFVNEEFVKVCKTAKKLKFSNKLEERKFKQDWEDMFEHDKKKAQTLKFEIEKTDKEIDQLVYELYGLNEEEIAILEGLND